MICCNVDSAFALNYLEQKVLFPKVAVLLPVVTHENYNYSQQHEHETWNE
jgi:glutamate racemase